MTEFITGDEGRLWLATHDMGLLRPWFDGDGKPMVTLRDGIVKPFDPNDGPVKECVLTKRQWNKLDTDADSMFRQRTPFLQTLKKLWDGQLMLKGFDGMAKMTLEEELEYVESDVVVSEQPLADKQRAPMFRLNALPLPITHCDWWCSKKMVAECDAGYVTNTVMAQAAVRRVADAVDTTFLGVHDESISNLFGIFNFLQALRIRKERPFKDAATLRTTIEDMMREAASRKFWGPFLLVHGRELDAKFDNDSDEPDKMQTTREQTMAVEGIADVVSVDHVNGQRLALVQVTPDVIQVVEGTAPIMVHWPTKEHSSTRHEWKFLTITVPRIRTDFHGNVGIVIVEG